MEYNDDLLIYYIHLHNKTAYDILYDKYLKLTKIILLKNIDFNVVDESDYEDLVQDCILLLNKAIYSYRNEEGTFYMYYHSVIFNVLYTNIKQIILRNNKLIFEWEENESFNNLFSTLKDSVNISESYSCDEERKYMINQCKNELETRVIHLKQEGYSYKEISSLLGINIKKVDYILTLLKKKYKKFCD